MTEIQHIPPAERYRLLAFYLPQFHPIPENNEWWEPGFTEWTNVGAAKPLYRGHDQPRVPADLGYYDLRLPEARQAQAELARAYGIEGFCYWHYWFAGRRILERPFNEVQASGAPDFPFCLAWANQTWTGIWHGAADRILVEQTYPGRSDYEAHFEAMRPAFEDARYITVDGRPLFFVYRPLDLPDSREFTDCWRELAEKAGLPGMYFIAIHDVPLEPLAMGFDASTGNPPIVLCRRLFANTRAKRWMQRLRRRGALPEIYSFPAMVERYFESWSGAETEYPCIVPGWDNTPRSKRNGVVLEDSTPEAYGRLLEKAMDLVADRDSQRRIVLIKSWNEWAEGNHLEPDRRYGRRYLEIQKQVLERRAGGA